jgi:hypothetical protein
MLLGEMNLWVKVILTGTCLCPQVITYPEEVEIVPLNIYQEMLWLVNVRVPSSFAKPSELEAMPIQDDIHSRGNL